MEVCQVRQGAVTEEELMKRRSLLALGGIDQGTLYAHGGEAAWVSAAGVHLLRDRVFSHPGLPADGSVYGIRAADGGFLAAINGGQGEGESYQSGLVRFDAEGAEGWEYPGWLAGFAWADEVAVGYTGSRISDLPAFPRILGPGPRTGTVVGTPVGLVDALGRALGARDGGDRDPGHRGDRVGGLNRCAQWSRQARRDDRSLYESCAVVRGRRRAAGRATGR